MNARTPRYLSFFFVTMMLLAGCAGSNQATTDTAPPSPDPAPATDAGQVAEQPTPNPIPMPASFEQAIRQGTRTRAGQPGSDYWQQEATYDLTARLYPDEKRLEGSGQMSYTNNAPQALGELRLELIQNLHAEGARRIEAVEVTGGMNLGDITYNGQPVQQGGGDLSYRVNGTQLVISLEEPLQPGETAELSMDWSFTIPQQGASGRMGYSKDNLFYIGYWYPVFSVYDDVKGWHTDQFLGSAEFYLGYADYDVTFEAPEEWFVMGTGNLENAQEVVAPDVLQRMRRAHQSNETVQVIGEDDFGAEATRNSENGRLSWHFTADNVRDVAYSATRESFFDAARTPVGDRDGDGETDYVDINTFYRASAPLWSEVTRYQQHAISFQSQHTGFAYPWPHMTAVEGAGIIGGGMEFPMMTVMGAYNAYGDTALYNVTAHELAHMWVPMVVGTNERHYSWMDEGMTTYLEAQSRQDFYEGVNAELQDQRIYASFATRSDAEGPIMRRSDYHYSTNAFVVASYMKPAIMMAALRGLLGRDTFMEGYHAFMDDWAYKHAYPWDFFNSFERVSGRDLDWFWRSFYFETWQLDQAVASVSREGGQTTIRIEDQGRASLPARLAITLESGRTLRREIPVETWLSGQTTAALTLDTDSPVQRVVIDPEQVFPDVDRQDNIWTQ